MPPRPAVTAGDRPGQDNGEITRKVSNGRSGTVFEVAGSPTAPYAAVVLTALRGREAETGLGIEARSRAAGRGGGRREPRSRGKESGAAS